MLHDRLYNEYKLCRTHDRMRTDQRERSYDDGTGSLERYSVVARRSNELLKDSNPEEYRDNKELEKQIRWEKGSWVIPMIIKTGSLPQWIVTFDRNGKLLRVKR